MNSFDDRQLNALREDPAPEFAARLRARLRQQAEPPARSPAYRRWTPWATAVATAAGIALAFTLPAVRTSAQSFLALFRVVSFVAVPVDESRFQQLTSQELDLPSLVGDRLEVLESSGPATAAVSTSQAGEAAGMDVLEPSYLPPNATLAGITVEGRSHARVTADADRLQQVMDTLGIDDLSVPGGLDGQVVDITVPPIVSLSYEQGDLLKARLRQVRTPDVLLPSGVNLQQLGEIGLRILGLPAQEARQFAAAIDWSSSLIVAIPPMASAFRQIDVDGQQGVLIQRREQLADGRSLTGNLLIWSGGGRVFSLEGTINAYELQMMANSLR